MAETTPDWVIEVGWDDSKAVRGKQRLDKMMQRVAKAEASAAGGRKISIQQEKSGKSLEQLERKRLEARQTLFRLQKLNPDQKEFLSLQNSLNATKTLAGYNQVILRTREAILRTRQQELKLAQKVGETVPVTARKGTPSEIQGPYSSLKAADPIAVRRQSQRLEVIASRMRAAFAAVPEGAGFDSQRKAVRELLGSVSQLQQELKRTATQGRLRELGLEFDTIKQKAQGLTSTVKQLSREQARAGAQKAPSERLVDPIAVQRQMVRIENLQRRAHEALQVTPKGPRFDEQRRAIEGLVERLKALKQAYMQAGTASAFRGLAPEMDRLASTTARYSTAAARAARQMNLQKFAAEKLRNSVANLAAGYVSVFTAIEGTRRFLNVGMEFESIDAMMLGASGSAEEAAENFRFVTKESMRLGSALLESTRSFAKFGTAAQLSGFSPEEARKMFTQIAEVNRAFGLSAADQGLAFLAIEQMVGKGKQYCPILWRHKIRTS